MADLHGVCSALDELLRALDRHRDIGRKTDSSSAIALGRGMTDTPKARAL
jgi:hypothetical protein